MFGAKIIVTSNPRGVMKEGVVGAGLTIYPGMVVQPDYTIAAQPGDIRTYKVYTPGSDGERPDGPYWIVREDQQQGRPATTPYVATERIFLYCPIQGEQLNLLLADVVGTADSHTDGDVLIVKSGTGKFIATTGSPESEPAVCNETLAALTADTLALCTWTGY